MKQYLTLFLFFSSLFFSLNAAEKVVCSVENQSLTLTASTEHIIVKKYLYNESRRLYLAQTSHSCALTPVELDFLRGKCVKYEGQIFYPLSHPITCPLAHQGYLIIEVIGYMPKYYHCAINNNYCFCYLWDVSQKKYELAAQYPYSNLANITQAIFCLTSQNEPMFIEGDIEARTNDFDENGYPLRDTSFKYQFPPVIYANNRKQPAANHPQHNIASHEGKKTQNKKKYPRKQGKKTSQHTRKKTGLHEKS